MVRFVPKLVYYSLSKDLIVNLGPWSAMMGFYKVFTPSLVIIIIVRTTELEMT
jgi:hypothetical protein